MKFYLKMVFIGLALLIVLFFTAYFFILFNGRSLIANMLENITEEKVTIGTFDLKLPMDMEIRNLNIPGLAEIDYIYISPSILGLLRGYAAFNEIKIIGSQIYFEKQAPKTVSSQATQGKIAEPGKAKAPVKKRLAYLFTKHLSWEDGELTFIDKTLSPDGIALRLKNISLEVNNLSLSPKSVITKFQLKGIVPWKNASQEGSIEANGWLNIFKKEMEASLNIKNIDGIYLYPYYSSWVDLEKSRIQKAKLNFASEVTGRNNEIVADCHLELTDIVFRPKEEQEPEDKAYRIAIGVIDLFKALDGKVKLDFVIRTKMDKPQFGFGNIRTAIEDKISRSRPDKLDIILTFPTKLLEKTVKGAADITKALINGTAAVGEQIKRGTEEIFKKKEINE